MGHLFALIGFLCVLSPVWLMMSEVGEDSENFISWYAQQPVQRLINFVILFTIGMGLIMVGVSAFAARI